MRRRAVVAVMSGLASSAFEFGGLRVAPQRSSDLSVTLGSLNPLLPGHVVVAPRRPVARYGDLTAAEADDVAAAVRAAQRAAPAADAFNVAIKDGAAAGQAVAHCHVHLVPRTRGDLPENDLIYGMIDGWTPGGEAAPAVTLDVPPDEARAPRTADDMAAEADAYATTAAAMAREPVGANGVAVASGPRPAGAVRFGKFALDPRQVFYVSASGLTRAIVNLKPLVPGHVLVVPAKNVPRVSSLPFFTSIGPVRCLGRSRTSTTVSTRTSGAPRARSTRSRSGTTARPARTSPSRTAPARGSPCPTSTSTCCPGGRVRGVDGVLGGMGSRC